jgi:putative PIN family toxin of toxin-antitoxin system
MAKVKVIFDCNIYLQAFLSAKGAASKCLKLVEEGLIELYLSRDIFSEIKDVLSRPEFQAKFPHATSENLTAFLEYLKEKAILIRSIGKYFELSRDKKDEPYLNLAMGIEADFIVS